MRVCLVLGKILSLLWQIVYAIGQILTAENAQILSKLTSHLVTLISNAF